LTLLSASFCFGVAYGNSESDFTLIKDALPPSYTLGGDAFYNYIALFGTSVPSYAPYDDLYVPTYAPTSYAPTYAPTSVQPPQIIQPTQTVQQFWSVGSYWHKKIPANAPLHPNSAQMVEWLINTNGHNNGHPFINYKSWTNPIYDAYKGTPKYDVYSEHEHKWYRNVPIPDGAKQSVDSDGGLGILDWDNWKFYDFWRFRYDNGVFKCGDGHIWDLSGSGVAPNGVYTLGGASIPTLALLIRPEEIQAGVINHPLACSLRTPKQGVKVYPPASTTDGKSYDRWAIPEGARIQLDPNLDLDSLGLSRTAKIVAKALQDYGMVVKECGGSFVIYAEHTLSANWGAEMAGNILMSIPAHWRIVDYSAFGASEMGARTY